MDAGLEKWPKVDITLLSKEHQEMYLKRKQAMDLYFMSERSVTDIIQQTGITLNQLFCKSVVYILIIMGQFWLHSSYSI